MSLSYLETDCSTQGLRLTERFGKAKRAAVQFKAVATSEVRDVVSTALFRQAAMRVTSALVVGFGLVQLAKYLLG